jgi:amino acid transporter
MTDDDSGSITHRIRRMLFGAPRDVKDQSMFHKISLIAFLAWVGLGADGLSSSSYGPEEAFRTLGSHTYLAIGLAVATALTVFIISYAYTRIVEHFPFGGGGYVVAGKLLGPRFGVISGAALLVDYVLTISVSISSGVDQVFSFMSPSVIQYKMEIVVIVIVFLTILNLRGVKESVVFLMPIFLVFLVTHIVLILGGLVSNAFEASHVVNEMGTSYNTGMKSLGFLGMAALFVRAYSMGAGTYTGIEAVSNGIQIMREPKVETAKRTMVYMAISLALTAGGILILYLLFHVTPEDGKTMNAVLLERFAGAWQWGGIPVGRMFVILTLVAEAALLFVAAQAGFIDGPRVMANMSIDSWLPHRFRSLSDSLTMHQGVLLISGSAIIALLFSKGNTSTLVLMYSINVFATFSLSELGMVRYWIKNRTKYPDWSRHIVIHVLGLILCVTILLINVFEKFAEGGWVTLVVTIGLIGLCFMIRKHYDNVVAHLKRLDDILKDLPDVPGTTVPTFNAKAPTAVLLVESYGGLGIHSFLTILRLFPNHFKNFIFVSISVIDAGNLKGIEDVNEAERKTEASLKKYVELAAKMGFPAIYRMSMGTELLVEAERVSVEIAKEHPRAIFYVGKLIFQKERWYQRLLHNETAVQFQRGVQFAGLNSMVLPVRVFENGTPPK